MIAPILIGAVATSIILGLLLRLYKGKISESSRLFQLGLLIVLSIAVGFTTFISFSSRYASPFLLLSVGAIVFIFGYLCTSENKQKRQERRLRPLY
ncbi:MAG: hypothetical protein ACW97G_14345 [Candidatus Thorarchaeota archaeon]